jgi:uncharacterized protein YktB (UPF0637 family)
VESPLSVSVCLAQRREGAKTTPHFFVRLFESRFEHGYNWIAPDLEHEEAKKRRKKGSSLLRAFVLSSDFVIAVRFFVLKKFENWATPIIRAL